MVHSQVSIIPEGQMPAYEFSRIHTLASENVSRAMLVELTDWACKLTEQGSIEWALRSQGKQTPGLAEALAAMLGVRHGLC